MWTLGQSFCNNFGDVFTKTSLLCPLGENSPEEFAKFVGIC